MMDKWPEICHNPQTPLLFHHLSVDKGVLRMEKRAVRMCLWNKEAGKKSNLAGLAHFFIRGSRI